MFNYVQKGKNPTFDTFSKKANVLNLYETY